MSSSSSLLAVVYAICKYGRTQGGGARVDARPLLPPEKNPFSPHGGVFLLLMGPFLYLEGHFSSFGRLFSPYGAFLGQNFAKKSSGAHA